MPGDYPFSPIEFTHVRLNTGLLADRIAANRRVTVGYNFQKCEETGRIDNFAIAGKLKAGEFRGIPYDDSDVYKVIEGASYCLATEPEPILDRYLDEVIRKIAAAQEPDGYLYTYRTIHPGDSKPHKRASNVRWLNELGAVSGGSDSHELYNVGHLYEAAAAHFLATGKRTLLNVAIRNANLICSVWGPGNDKLKIPPGHQEIEIGLVKLYRVTGEPKYLNLAKFLLDIRGNATSPNPIYYADHKPVVDQDEAVGHAVRSQYMYCAMTDIAAITSDEPYSRAVDRLWDNVVSKKLYLTGGLGARHGGEAFGENFELPNKEAYNETCAAVAGGLWNHRLFLLHGDSKYIDVLERIIYNGFLAGVSLTGDRFFYANPLESDGKWGFNTGKSERAPWFDCSCCPVNVVRFLPAIAGMMYALREDTLFVNLYAGSEGETEAQGSRIRLNQRTDYPWDGHIRIKIDVEPAAELAIALRIPGWVHNRPVPSELYRYLETGSSNILLKVNGREVAADTVNGYAMIRRRWTSGDSIELQLPMQVKRVVADSRVAACCGRVAVERGPIVYCAEGVDHGGGLSDVTIADSADLTVKHRPELLGGVTVVSDVAAGLSLIPYFAWNHRGAGEMAVWLPRRT